ncbi:MAG: hypothetical protein DMF77_14845 [Acidobacteria bacterium]|nr:MAG: hypothetical protein DMF77_14845 [Acidobacteriota bacterium]
MSALDLLRLWFGLSEPVSRRAYALSGFGLMALKYVTETALVHHVTGRWLTPLDYFNPLLTSRLAAIGGPGLLSAALIVWTLPFLWIGVSMTMRRAEDAGGSPFLALLYFLPLVNYLMMLTLCLVPSRPRTTRSAHALDEPRGGHALRSALLGAGAGLAIAILMVGVSVMAFGQYGTTLFVATPFVMGAAAAYVFNLEQPRPVSTTLGVAMLTVVAAGGAILLFALEGVLCLLMAAPPAILMALMGAWLGRALVRRPGLGAPGIAMVLLPLPLLAGIEVARPSPPLSEVRTTVEIAAPLDVVWRHVVTFSDLREPPAWLFRLGIAYPQRATITGRGVGALRRCEFSTGPFLEPITAWEEPTRLAFDVAAQPPPLTEWSPYRHVAAPHLDGYLRVHGGEFRLRPLPGGRTLLEGRTFYEMRMFPTAYWRLWSDALIHAIHQRVLRHIRALSEASPL